MEYSAIISGYKWTNKNLTFSFLTSVPVIYAGETKYSQTFAPITVAM